MVSHPILKNVSIFLPIFYPLYLFSIVIFLCSQTHKTEVDQLYIQYYIMRSFFFLSVSTMRLSSVFAACEYFSSKGLFIPGRSSNWKSSYFLQRRWRPSVSWFHYKTNNYSPLLCYSNQASLPVHPSQPPAIYPDTCNQLEQQIVAGRKNKTAYTDIPCILYVTQKLFKDMCKAREA